MRDSKIDFVLVEEHIVLLNQIQERFKHFEKESDAYNKNKTLASFYIESSHVNYLLRFYQDALSDLKKAAILDEKIDEPLLSTNLNLLLGKIHLQFTNFDHADLHLKKALRIAKKENFIALKLEILENLGLIFIERKHPERAFRFFEQKVKLLIKQHDENNLDLAFTYVQIGVVLSKFDVFKSLSLFHKARIIFVEKQFNEGIDAINLTLGKLYFDNKEYEESKIYFNKTILYSNNEKSLVEAYAKLSSIAEISKEPLLALKYLKEFNRLNQRLNSQIRLSDNKATKKQFELKKIFDEGKFTVSSGDEKSVLIAKIDKKNKLIERLNMVAEQTDNVVVVLDPEGNFEWTNERFEIRSGMTLQQFMKERGKNIKDASYNSDIAELLNQCIASRLPVHYNSFYRLENDDIRYQSSKICPIYGDDNSLKNFVVIDSDITEIRRVQNIIQQKNKDITDSINYAKRIQEAILPTRDSIQSDLGDAFVLFRPRDIVSGDFYWLTRVRNHILFAVCDCTGHGVPGAFMSMIGNDYLTQIVVDDDVSTPGQTLSLLDKKIVTALKQTGEPGEAKDGMDAALCAIDFNNMKLEFSGAKRPLIIIRDQELIEVKGSKYSIGGNQIKNKFFDSHNLSVQKGDCVYIFSDGYHDQFGGLNNKKFSIKRLKKLLLAIHQLPIQEQKDVLENTFDSWKSETEQVDDICVIGLKI